MYHHIWVTQPTWRVWEDVLCSRKQPAQPLPAIYCVLWMKHASPSWNQQGLWRCMLFRVLFANGESFYLLANFWSKRRWRAVCKPNKIDFQACTTSNHSFCCQLIAQLYSCKAVLIMPVTDTHVDPRLIVLDCDQSFSLTLLWQQTAESSTGVASWGTSKLPFLICLYLLTTYSCCWHQLLFPQAHLRTLICVRDHPHHMLT